SDQGLQRSTRREPDQSLQHGWFESEVPPRDRDARTAAAHEPAQREQRPYATTDVRGDRRSLHAERGKRTQPEDEAWPERNVDCVRQPENAHRDRRVAGTA